MNNFKILTKCLMSSNSGIKLKDGGLERYNRPLKKQ